LPSPYQSCHDIVRAARPLGSKTPIFRLSQSRPGTATSLFEPSTSYRLDIVSRASCLFFLLSSSRRSLSLPIQSFLQFLQISPVVCELKIRIIRQLRRPRPSTRHLPRSALVSLSSQQHSSFSTLLPCPRGTRLYHPRRPINLAPSTSCSPNQLLSRSMSRAQARRAFSYPCYPF